MTKIRTWACFTAGAVLALLIERRIEEMVKLDADNMGPK